MYTGDMTAKKAVPLLVRLPPELHEVITAMAHDQDRSLNNLIVRTLKQTLMPVEDERPVLERKSA